MLLLTRIRAAGAACALTIAAGTAAAGPLLRIDSEQEAASAIISASFVEHETTGLLQVITTPAFEYALLPLSALAAATTPAALAQIPGMTFACRDGGSFVARNSPAAPRVVDVEFVDCKPYRFFDNTAQGPLRLTLLSNSFAADRLAGIRLGSSDRDFVLVAETVYPDQITLSTTSHNLTMRGLVTVPRNQQSDGVAATSLYELTGFRNQHDRVEIPGRDTHENTSRQSAEHVLVSTSFTFENDFMLQDDDTKFLWGSLTQVQVLPSGSFSSRYDVAGLRVHRITDFESWTDTLTLDGAVRYTWPTAAPAGCLSGGYLFDTRTPLHRPNLDSPALDAGELVINRDLTVRAYAPGNVPAGLPAPTLGMLLNVKVRGVGTYNFDAESLNGPALWAEAQCPYQ